MSKKFVRSQPFPEFSLWHKMKERKSLFDFEYEITERCNLNCRHCYINRPASDEQAKKNELSLEALKPIVDEAVSLGAVWCLVTGGEPLLRPDFREIYLYLKQKGLFISIFTNATLISEELAGWLHRYPPRDIEVTVYGATREVFEKVTRVPGSFEAFLRGLDLLEQNGLKVKLKAMALQSNVHEMTKIMRFCRERGKGAFRFDPFLQLRYDRNVKRNQEIKAERLSPTEIVALERSDSERFQYLRDNCKDFIVPKFEHNQCKHLLHCGAGTRNFTLSADGHFRLCSALCHPDCVYDLRGGSLADAWQNFVPRVRAMESHRKHFIDKCRKCSLINLCMWCAAHVYLETGELDAPVDYFCELAHARSEALEKT